LFRTKAVRTKAGVPLQRDYKGRLLFGEQCDLIGRNFAIWVIRFGVGRIFVKYRPNNLGELVFQSPKIRLNKLYVGSGYVLPLNSQMLTSNF
jgi:hypothetical protein